MTIWMTICGVLAAIAVGLPLSILLTAPIRRNRKAFAIASALVFAFGMYNPNAEKLVETGEENDYAKRQKGPGDPPEPDANRKLV